MRESRLTADWRSAPNLHGCDQVPRQADGVSCGIHLLIGLWCCMSSVDPNKFLGSGGLSANDWRDRITLSLYIGSLARVAVTS